MPINSDRFFTVRDEKVTIVLSETDDSVRAIGIGETLVANTDLVDTDPTNALVLRDGKLYVAPSTDTGGGGTPAPDNGDPEASAWA